MDFMDTILCRKSIRKYTGASISDAELQTILAAAQAAPVGRAKYDYLHLSVITDADLLKEIDHNAAVGFGNPDMHPLYGAPMLIIVSSKTDRESLGNTEYSNAAIVVHNMALAAVTLGTGHCDIWGSIAMMPPRVGRQTQSAGGLLPLQWNDPRRNSRGIHPPRHSRADCCQLFEVTQHGKTTPVADTGNRCRFLLCQLRRKALNALLRCFNRHVTKGICRLIQIIHHFSVSRLIQSCHNHRAGAVDAQHGTLAKGRTAGEIAAKENFLLAAGFYRFTQILRQGVQIVTGIEIDELKPLRLTEQHGKILPYCGGIASVTADNHMGHISSSSPAPAWCGRHTPDAYNPADIR